MSAPSAVQGMWAKTIPGTRDAATEQDNKHCTVCGYVAEAPTGHTHAGTLVPGQEPTCTQAGSKAYYTCTCQQNFEDEACTTPIIDLGSWRVIPPTGHSWSDTCLAANTDAEKHYHVCTVCNARDAGEAHVYDNTEDIDCSICGYERQVTPPVGTEFTVSFDPNGGSVSPSSAVTTDGKLTNLPIPTRSGYNFAGWYSEPVGGQPVTVNTAFTKNTTIYAIGKSRTAATADPSTMIASPTTPCPCRARLRAAGSP